MIIIGISIAGAVLGGMAGLWIGFAEGGDFNFAPVVYGPIGAAIGAIGGCIVGVLVS